MRRFVSSATTMASSQAAIAEADRGVGPRRSRGHARDGPVHRFVDAVTGARQRRVDAVALSVEQDRILEAARKDAAFLEAGEEDEAPG